MAKIQRFGSVSRVTDEEAGRRYAEFHADPFDGVNEMIKACNLQNYSIYYFDGYLFSYFEYVGEDYEADMAKMAADPRTQAWWAAVDPLMKPLSDGDRPWTDMTEVYHLD